MKNKIISIILILIVILSFSSVYAIDNLSTVENKILDKVNESDKSNFKILVKKKKADNTVTYNVYTFNYLLSLYNSDNSILIKGKVTNDDEAYYWYEFDTTGKMNFSASKASKTGSIIDCTNNDFNCDLIYSNKDLIATESFTYNEIKYNANDVFFWEKWIVAQVARTNKLVPSVVANSKMVVVVGVSLMAIILVIMIIPKVFYKLL